MTKLAKPIDDDDCVMDIKHSNPAHFSFDGDETSLPEFLDRFTIFAKAKAWKDEEIANHFPLYLQGSAFDAYVSIYEAFKNKWTTLLPVF